MRVRVRLAALAVFMLASACRDATSPSDALTAARRRWEAWGPASYDLWVQRGPCECAPSATVAVEVRVRDGVVTRIRLDDGTVPTDPWLEYPAVSGLFDIIANAVASGEQVEVVYDPMTGVPQRISISPEAGMVDGGFTLEIVFLKLDTPRSFGPG